MFKKIRLILLLCIFTCLSLVLGFACGKNPINPTSSDPNEGDSSTEKYTITGFEVPETITVKAGENVTVTTPLVLDNKNNVMDVHVLVTDENGGFIEVKGNKFFAFGGIYKIQYFVQTYDGTVYAEETTVYVEGNYYLGVNMQQVYFLNEVVTLNASHRLDNPSISYAVTAPDGKTVVDLGGENLDANQFVATQSGLYKLSVTAKEVDTTYNYETSIYVYDFENVEAFGAIEIFNDHWEEIRKLSGYGLQSWSVVDTDECGLTNYKGAPDHFIKASTYPGWYGGLDLWLNPIFDQEHYENLVKLGYKKVIVPIYADAKINYGVYNYLAGHSQGDASGYYKSWNCGEVPGQQWKLVEINLEDNFNDWKRSFISAFYLYKNQVTQFINVTVASGIGYDLYIGSIYATKEVKITSDYGEEVKDDKGKVVLGERNVSLAVNTTLSNSNYQIKVFGSDLETVYQNKIDENGEIVYETDENGDFIYEKDENGDDKLDENGEKIKIPVKVPVQVLVENKDITEKTELEYAVTFRGKTQVLEGSSYTFTANGDYVVSVYPKQGDLQGAFKFNIHVDDEVVLSHEENAKLGYPREPGNSRIISFADLRVVLTTKEDARIDNKDITYEVYFGGKQIDSATNDFIAYEDGNYTVVAVGKYASGSVSDPNVKDLTTYKEFIVKVYSTTDVGVIDKQKHATINIVDKINTMMEYEVAKEFTSYEIYKIIGLDEVKVDVDAIDEKGILTTSMLVDGYYKIYATDTNGIIETVFIDLWDSKVGHLWNDVSENGLDYVEALGNFYQRKFGYAYLDAAFTQKAVEIVEVDGKAFYKYSHTDNYPLYFKNGQEFSFKQSVGFEVKPIHSKAYYEDLLAQDYKVIFDFMFVKDLEEGNVSTMSNFVYHNISWDHRGNLSSNTIYTFEGDLVQLSALLTNWDWIQSGTTDIDDSYKNAFITNYWAAWNNSDQTGVKDVDMYIGNIRLANKTTTVRTEYYLQKEDGTYNETAPDSIIEKTQWVCGGVTAEYRDYNGYYMDIEKTGSLTSYDIVEGETTVIKVYFAIIPGVDLGLVNTNQVASIDVTAKLNELMETSLTFSDYKLYRVLGQDEVLIENADLSNGIVDLSNIEGLYFVEVNASNNKRYRLTFDAYSPDKVTWTEFSKDFIINHIRSDGAASFNVGKGTMTTTTRNGNEIDVLRFEKASMNSHNWYVFTPIHSKAYYEALKGQGYTLSYSVYVDAPAGKQVFNQLLAYGKQIDTDGNMSAKWHDFEITLDKFLDGWDNYTTPENYNNGGAWGTRNQYGMFYMYAPKSDAAIFVTDCTFTNK